MSGAQKWKADTPGPVRRLSAINNDIFLVGDNNCSLTTSGIIGGKSYGNKILDAVVRWKAIKPKDESKMSTMNELKHGMNHAVHAQRASTLEKHFYEKYCPTFHSTY
jgi:hypothetical protein